MATDLASHGCVYNYVVTAHPPTAVSHSVVGSFTAPNEINLIIDKCTRIEIYRITAEGLEGLLDIPLYGRIVSLKLFRPEELNKDLLFICTEKLKFCLLEYDAEAGELVTRANGDLSEKIGRPVESGALCVVHPEAKCIALHLYTNLLKIVPIAANGELQEAFNVRLEEMAVLDIAFLHASQPTIALLHEDPKENRHIKTYKIDIAAKDHSEGPWSHQHLDAGSQSIIALPRPLGGAIVVGETVLTYFNSAAQHISAYLPRQTVIRSHGRIDEDGTRWLLGDHMGGLHLLVVAHDGARVLSLRLQHLGATSLASTISYVDSGVVYIGSQTGDSQLISLRTAAATADDGDGCNMVEVLETFTSLAPIVDFAVVDLDRQGQGQIVTCSGAGKSGSLRLVRNGIGISEAATIELAGIRGIWSARRGSMETFDAFLVLTFVGETRVLAMNEDDELDEVEVAGFDAAALTLFCGNAVHDQLVQVTSNEVRLVAADTRQMVATWRDGGGCKINMAAGNDRQLLLAGGSGLLVYIEIEDGAIVERGRTSLSDEIACIDIYPTSADGDVSKLAAVGTWARRLHLVTLPTLTALTQHDIGGEVIPRSTLFAVFDAQPYLLLGMGDGRLVQWKIVEGGDLADRKTVPLGTKPIALRTFMNNGTPHVFAASDRPTVIYSINQKLHYSNLNENDVITLCSFNSESSPDSLAIGKVTGLTIGSIDEIQKLHIRTIPLGEQPRRIAHQEATRTFGVLTMADRGGGECSVRIVEDGTFETVAVLPLQPTEMGNTIASVQFDGDDKVYYVVGTAFVIPDEEEPKRGRILVLQYDRDTATDVTMAAADDGAAAAVGCGKVHVVCDKDVNGSVYCAESFQGKLVACIGSSTVIYSWLQQGSQPELTQECTHQGHIIALYVATRGDFVLVGDLMKSLELLQYKPEEGVLEQRAQDNALNWMTAVAMLDDDVFIGAENSGNLFTVRKNSDAANDDERAMLDTVGEFHVGDFINRFRKGSIVMQLPDSDTAVLPTLLFGTISGIIGVIASLPNQLYVTLEKLQQSMRDVVRGVGGLDHASWRAWQNEARQSPAHGFIDGDLIEQFLDLPRAAMEDVCKRADMQADDVLKIVEDLTRLH